MPACEQCGRPTPAGYPPGRLPPGWCREVLTTVVSEAVGAGTEEFLSRDQPLLCPDCSRQALQTLQALRETPGLQEGPAWPEVLEGQEAPVLRCARCRRTAPTRYAEQWRLPPGWVELTRSLYRSPCEDGDSSSWVLCPDCLPAAPAALVAQVEAWRQGRARRHEELDRERRRRMERDRSVHQALERAGAGLTLEEAALAAGCTEAEAEAGLYRLMAMGWAAKDREGRWHPVAAAYREPLPPRVPSPQEVLEEVRRLVYPLAGLAAGVREAARAGSGLEEAMEAFTMALVNLDEYLDPLEHLLRGQGEAPD